MTSAPRCFTKSFAWATLLFSLLAVAGESHLLAAQSAAPSRLSDAQFWNLIATSSEAGGTFPSDNFTSNEAAIGQLVTVLRARGRTGGAYIGVGPEQNFSYIAALRPEVVFIVDIRRQAVIQHLMYKALFELSANRTEFIGRLFSYPLQKQTRPDISIGEIWDSYLKTGVDTNLVEGNLAQIRNHLVSVRHLALSEADLTSLAYVYRSFVILGPSISYRGANSAVTATTFGSLSLITDSSTVERSFLASEDDFQFVRNLHNNNLFIPIVGDFAGPGALRSVGTCLRQWRMTVNAFYVSNVEDYLFGATAAFQRFYASAETLPLDSLSVFIRPPPGNAYRIAVTNYRFASVAARQQADTRIAPPVATRSAPAPVPAPTVAPPVPPVAPAPPTVPTPTARPGLRYPPQSAGLSVSSQQDPRSGMIQGSIVDSTTRARLAHSSVQLWGLGVLGATSTDGTYLISNVPPGSYTIEVTRRGYSTKITGSVKVAAGVPTTVDFNLTPNGFPVVTLMTVTSPQSRPSASQVEFASQPGNHVAICPMIPFLNAFEAGRVVSVTQALWCVR